MGPQASSAPAAAVTVYSVKRAAGGLLVRHPRLDADGKTLSVVGAKSALPGRSVGDRVVVRLAGGGLVVGTVTHIHRHDDRYRAAVTVADVLRVGGQLPPALRTAPPDGELNWVGCGPAAREAP